MLQKQLPIFITLGLMNCFFGAHLFRVGAPSFEDLHLWSRRSCHFTSNNRGMRIDTLQDKFVVNCQLIVWIVNMRLKFGRK